MYLGRIIILIFTIALFHLVLLPGCTDVTTPSPTNVAPNTPPTPPASAPTPPHTQPPSTEGKFTLSDSPILGKSVQVIYTFWMSEESRWDTANVTAEINIPNEFEFVDGDLQWQGELSKGSKIELIATIKAVQKGTCELTARAGFSPNPGDWRVCSETIYALILSDRGFLSDNWNGLPGEGGTVGYGTPTATSDDTVILLDLSMPHPPALGETAELTLTATAILDAPRASVRIQLPKALSMVSGNGETWFGPDIWQLKWSGDLAKGDRNREMDHYRWCVLYA